MSAESFRPRPMTRHGKPIADGRMPLVCVSLMGLDRESLLAESESLVRAGVDVLEWRVDHYGLRSDLSVVMDTAQSLRAALPETPLIFTYRSVGEGGRGLPVAPAVHIELLLSAAEKTTFDFIDVEMSLGESVVAQICSTAGLTGTQCILSVHDFLGTPDEPALYAHFAKAAQWGGSVAKVAVMPQSADDVLRLLTATRRAAQSLPIPIISMAMGQLGAMSRIYGAEFGSALTFAAAENSSAPGQIALAEMQALLQAAYRQG